MDPEVGYRLARGDRGALDDVYRGMALPVLGYLRRFVGRDDAEDVLQQTFLDVWRSAARFDPSRSLSSWVFTIAQRRAIDHLRQRHATVVPVEEFSELTGEDGRAMVERHAWACDIRQVLRQLPDGQREVIELAYFEDLRQRDIAERLDIPIGTVKARMSRGMRSLTTLLLEEGDR